nr:butyryl-CoA:acetate CoA-transferase [Spirochaetota bacterium]
VHYVVTEFGKAMLKGKSTRERAEELIRIAHPDFREELIREAEKMNLWTRTAGIA